MGAEQKGGARLDALALELLRDAPCGIAVSDPDGGLYFVNKTLLGWLGRSPDDKAAPPGISDILTVPGRIYLQTHVMPMLQLQGFVREIAVHVLREDQPPLPVLLNAVLRRDDAGAPQRIDYTIFDATERSRYESELRHARIEAEELAAIVRTSPNAILRVDARGIVLSWNAGAEAQLSCSTDAALGQPVEELVALADAPAWFTANRGSEATVIEGRLDNGRMFEVTMAPIGADPLGGEEPDYSVVLRDVTDRKRAERSLRLMVREMDHRVKNTLSVVNAIARQTLAGDDSKVFIQRLRALSRAHDALTEAHWDTVDLRLLLRIIQDEAGGPERLGFEGPAVALAPRHMTALSMVFHEMITNALKYGSLSRRRGRIDIDYRLSGSEQRKLKIDWRETGGPAVVKPEARGFGTRMITTILGSEFNGSIKFEFTETGLKCRMTLDHADPQ